MMKGILVVSFGTTYREAREKAIDCVERRIEKQFPSFRCYRAFSSRTVRRILLERDGIYVPDDALRKTGR